MNDKNYYRLSQVQKNEIAQNLIDILEHDTQITELTRTFIGNWVLTDWKEKTKAYFDVWDIVLKNYLPTERPILFRSCSRISKKRIIFSFTGRLECARRFAKGTGYLIICDTKEQFEFESIYSKAGQYKQSFYPLVKVLNKAKASGGWGFSDYLLNESVGEDEYIVKIYLNDASITKWVRNND